MIDTEYLTEIRELSEDYYRNHIGFERYRTERKIVLDKIDERYNGRKFVETPVQAGESLAPEEALDTAEMEALGDTQGDTQRGIRRYSTVDAQQDNKKEPSIFMRTIALFKPNEDEK